MQQLTQMAGVLKNASDPMEALNQLSQGNPQIAQALQTARQYGDPKTAFYALAKERGADPEEILRQVRGMF